ncbi:MAG TPA: histidinol-phosphate transaminase [Methanosarcinaceae archaeon]|nr:histidinol-phosphate transaminase [Methanosarcinaceae archaeon]
MSRVDLIKEEIFGIKEYVPGKSIEDIARAYGLDPDSIIKLGSNENPLGPSPKAVDALIEHASKVSIYPSADACELVDALSGYTGFPASNIAASGPGMDGLIDGLMRLIITHGDEVIIPTPTFSYYEIAARANGAVPVFVKRDEDYAVDVEALLEAVSSRTKVIFLCSPNNPSGNLVSELDVRAIAESTRSLVFVDEAYVEFADSSLAHLVNEYDNIIVGRTFSKAFGLAGLRIGYGIMPQWLKSEYMRVATPFNVSSAAIAAGVAALSDVEHLEKSIELAREGREYLKEHIPFKVHDSQANFVMVNVALLKAKDVCDGLLEKGIIVRDCSSFRNAGESLIRVTVGMRGQNNRVVEGFGAFGYQ